MRDNFLGEFRLYKAENEGYLLMRHIQRGDKTQFYVGRDLDGLVKEFVAALAKERLDDDTKPDTQMAGADPLF